MLSNGSGGSRIGQSVGLHTSFTAGIPPFEFLLPQFIHFLPVFFKHSLARDLKSESDCTLGDWLNCVSFRHGLHSNPLNVHIVEDVKMSVYINTYLVRKPGKTL